MNFDDEYQEFETNFYSTVEKNIVELNRLSTNENFNKFLKDNKKKIKPEFINTLEGNDSDHLKLLTVLKDNDRVSLIGGSSRQGTPIPRNASSSPINPISRSAYVASNNSDIPDNNSVHSKEYEGYDKIIKLDEIIKYNEVILINEDSPSKISVSVHDKKFEKSKADANTNNNVIDGYYRKLVNFEKSDYEFKFIIVRVKDQYLIIYKSINLPEESEPELQILGIEKNSFYIFNYMGRFVIATTEYDINNELTFKIIGFISRKIDSKLPIDVEGNFYIVNSLDTFKLKYIFDGEIDKSNLESIRKKISELPTEEIKDIKLEIKISDYIKKTQEVPDKYINISYSIESKIIIKNDEDPIKSIKKIIFLNKENYLELKDKEGKKILPDYLNLTSLSYGEDKYYGTYDYQKIDIDLNPNINYKNSFYGYRHIKNKNLVIILYPISYTDNIYFEDTYEITWVVFDLYIFKLLSYQIVDDIKTYSAPLDLEDGNGEQNYLFNKLLTDFKKPNWSNNGLIKNKEYSIYKYKITSTELLEPNVTERYIFNKYQKLLENHNLIDISYPNEFLKKLIEINSEELKNFPRKITVDKKDFEYVKIEIGSDTIYGYTNHNNKKIIIFIPTLLNNGIFNQNLRTNNLFLCHRFKHEKGKEMLVKKFVFKNILNNYVYPPYSHNYKNELESIESESLIYEYDIEAVKKNEDCNQPPECENPPEIKEKKRFKRRKQTLGVYFKLIEEKYVLKEITDSKELKSCHWYDLFIDILYKQPLTMEYFNEYILETINSLNIEKERKMFLNFFGFNLEKGATFDNLLNSFFEVMYTSFKDLMIENESIFIIYVHHNHARKKEKFISNINSINRNFIHELRKNNLKYQFVDGLISLEELNKIYVFFGVDDKPKIDWRSKWGTGRKITPLKEATKYVEDDITVDKELLILTKTTDRHLKEEPNKYIIQYLSRIFNKEIEETKEYINNTNNEGNLIKYMKNIILGNIEFEGNTGVDWGGVRPSFFGRNNNSVMGDYLNNIFQTIEQHKMIENYLYENYDMMLEKFNQSEKYSKKKPTKKGEFLSLNSNRKKSKFIDFETYIKQKKPQVIDKKHFENEINDLKKILKN